MSIAANGLATVAVVGQELGLVADADLAHLDPGLERAGEILDQFAKVDPLLRQVIEHHSFAAEDDLDVNQVHLEPATGDELLARLERDLTRLGELGLGIDIPGRGGAEDLTPGRVFQDLADRSVAGQRTSPNSVPRSVRTITRCPRGCS